MRRGSSADRVVVTGAGGFLGAALIGRLGAGAIGIGRRAARGILAFDLRDPEQARAAVRETRPTRVYHLAGDARATGWEELWLSHVTATVNLLTALTARGEPVRVVVAASSAEYGAAGGRRAKETSPTEPVSLYGACKLAQTLAALSFSRRTVEVAAARIFNVVGPGTPGHLAPGAFASQVARIADGRQEPEIVVGDLGARRDYLDVRDAASALEIVMRRGEAGGLYNVGSGRSRPMSEILRGLIAAGGVKARVSVDPSRRRRSEVPDLAADAGRLRALGWTPHVPLARSLADTVASWRGR